MIYSSPKQRLYKTKFIKVTISHKYNEVLFIPYSRVRSTEHYHTTSSLGTAIYIFTTSVHWEREIMQRTAPNQNIQTESHWWGGQSHPDPLWNIEIVCSSWACIATFSCQEYFFCVCNIGGVTSTPLYRVIKVNWLSNLLEGAGSISNTDPKIKILEKFSTNRAMPAKCEL